MLKERKGYNLVRSAGLLVGDWRKNDEWMKQVNRWFLLQTAFLRMSQLKKRDTT